MTLNQFFGTPLHAEQFAKEYAGFTSALSPLFETMNKVFVREGAPTAGADTLAFFLGRKCCEEFFEIVSLSANGYSVGLMKLLRSLYENAVTLAYLAKNPQEVERFVDFHAVHVRRGYERIREVFGNDWFESSIPPERIKHTEEQYQIVREKFFTSSCNKCGAKSIQPSWTRKSIETLANLVGEEYKILYPECYFFPNLQLHTTPVSIMGQIQDVDGKLVFDPESGKGLIESALCAAHRLIVQILFTQNDHFQLGLDEELIVRFHECMEAWPEPE